MLNAQKSEHPRTCTDEEYETRVVLTFANRPKETTRQRPSQQLSIPGNFMRCLLHKLRLKPYRPRLLDFLLVDDLARLLQYCVLMRDHITKEQAGLLDKITWSDKASFKLPGQMKS